MGEKEEVSRKEAKPGRSEELFSGTGAWQGDRVTRRADQVAY